MSKKIPRVNECVNARKIPRKGEIDPNSYLAKSPSWRFSCCDKNHEKWKVDHNKIDAEILEKLVAYESMTWQEILNQTNGRGHSKNHRISVHKIHKDAQKRLNELNITEDTLFSLAPKGKLRLFGQLVDGVFYFLWIDPNHEVCPSKKKHT